jgi:hypothetical protein
MLGFLRPGDLLALERVDRLLLTMCDNGTVDQHYWRPRYEREYGGPAGGLFVFIL